MLTEWSKVYRGEKVEKRRKKHVNEATDHQECYS